MLNILNISLAKIKLICLTLFFISLYFPFASFYPLSTDVQPVVFFFAGIILFPIKSYEFNGTKFLYIFLIIFSLFTLFYVNMDSDFKIIKRLGFTTGVILFFSIQNNFKYLSSTLLKNIAIIHILAMFLQLISPEIFNITLLKFINRNTYFANDSRGQHGLNAEQGGASAVMFALYLSAFYFKNTLSILTKKDVINYNITMLLAIIGLIMARAGLSGILLIAITLLSIPKKNRTLYLIILFFTLIILISFIINKVTFFEIRVLDILKVALENPSLLLYYDSSISERLIGLMYGFFSLLHHPLGFGGGGYSIAAKEVEYLYHFSLLFPTARPQIDDTVSTTGIYLAEYGIFYVIFLCILFIHCYKNNFLNIITLSILLSFLFFSFSIAFPVTWLIFSILIKYNTKKYE
jgi:hypothetical protein